MLARIVLATAVLAGSGCDVVYGLERDRPAPGDWATVSAGDRHTCGIKLDGTLWCWGGNAADQLGLEVPRAVRATQIDTATWRDVSAGATHTCGIRTDDTLWCWGDNSGGALGVGDQPRRLTPTQVEIGRVTHVRAGLSRTCALGEDASLWCWGDNGHGQIGDGSRTDRTSPVQVPGAWTSVSLGALVTCGIQTDATLWCWGNNTDNQFADPNFPGTESSLVPRRAPGEWTHVAVSREATCAVDTRGLVRCWGDNAFGQLGDGTTTSSALGVAVGGSATDWTSVTAGEYHVCGHRASGALYCWGSNARGQVPTTDSGEVVSLPLEIVPEVDAWRVIAPGSNHLCLIDEGHRLYCAGINAEGQLGRGTGDHLTPVRVPGTWHALTTGGGFTCALDDAGEVHCWGESRQHSLGDGEGRAQQTPSRIAAAGPWDEVVAGKLHACARRGAERWCWGSNQYGVFGDDTVTSALLPKPITSGRWATAATYHACAVDSGALHCWGYNYHGQVALPRSDFGTRTPTQVGTDTTWNLVATGGSHTCGTNSSGLYCWGRTNTGQLGIAPEMGVAQYETPIAVAVANGAATTALALGESSSCALIGTVATCWGRNSQGELGIGTQTSFALPTALDGEWRQLALGERHACGIRTDGTLACWGDNSHGRLGDGTLTTRSVPTALDASTDWERVVTGDRFTCATKLDRSLWCWGSNEAGEIGDGTAWSGTLERVE